MLSTAYHPQTDRQTEQINQEIGIFLRHYINYQQDNWTEWLAAAEFQYNDKKHIATEHIPFKLNFGQHLLWQLLDTMSNGSTTSKSLSRDI